MQTGFALTCTEREVSLISTAWLTSPSPARDAPEGPAKLLSRKLLRRATGRLEAERRSRGVDFDRSPGVRATPAGVFRPLLSALSRGSKLWLAIRGGEGADERSKPLHGWGGWVEIGVCVCVVVGVGGTLRTTPDP